MISCRLKSLMLAIIGSTMNLHHPYSRIPAALEQDPAFAPPENWQTPLGVLQEPSFKVKLRPYLVTKLAHLPTLSGVCLTQP